MLAVLLSLGCSGTGGDDAPPPSGTDPSADLVFTDANTYDFVATLDLAAPTAAAGADVVLDWSGIDTDYRGRPFDPTDADQVTIAAIELEREDLLVQINENGLDQEDIIRYYQHFPVDATSARFSEFSILGQPFDYETEFVDGFSPSWLLTLWKENEKGTLEILSSQFALPEVDGPTEVQWANTTATLDFDPDLSATPLLTLPDAAPYTLDWSAVTVDVNGAPYNPLLGDTLRISHLPVEGLDEAADALLQLDLVADQTYCLDVFGLTSAPDLSAAVALDGSAFPGFTPGGTWLVGVECTQLSCFSPAPLILAVVEVR